MKKFYAILAVLAMVCISSMAYAVDVTVGGRMEIRSRDFDTLNYNNSTNAGNVVDTQERIELDVNAKAGDNVKGKIALWNDFDDWGRFEQVQGNNGFGNSTAATGGHFGFREAWVSFDLPGVPVNVTAGHQLLTLGNGWFFRSGHFGSDAWVVSNVTGNNTAALVNVKISEGLINIDDDADAYALLDVIKLNENATLGANLTYLDDRRNALGKASGTNPTDLENLEVTFNGKLGPLNLMAQVDAQAGTATEANLQANSGDAKFKGNEVVVQGNIALDPTTFNFTLARGSGPKIGQTDYNQFVNLLDIDPHYTFLYEYKTVTACGAKNTGFCNTTAVNVGATVAVAKSLTIGLNLWYLQATEKMAKYNDATATSSDLGEEVDLDIAWKLYDSLTWTWDLGYLKPGDALGGDNVTGIQGILSFKF